MIDYFFFPENKRKKNQIIMNNHFSYENFGPIGGGGIHGGGGIGGGGIHGGFVGGGGIGGGPRSFRRMGHGRPNGMSHLSYYHHPKPRYHYNYYPYYYYNNFYPYNSYYYPVVSSNDQDFCFCTDPEDDKQNQEKMCVENTCGVCIPRSLCATCDEKITCKKQGS